MKHNQRFLPIFLTLIMGVTALASCGDNGGTSSSDGEVNTPNATTISSTVLDGKVANLMSANGIAIQDKNQNAPTVVATNAKNTPRIITAKAEGDSTMMPQAKNEFVKETDDGMQDVRFHSSEKGSYREWNKRFDKHHHKGQECPTTDCDELSDEIESEEQNTPTIVSLDARVNKLYNTGKFTFLCVSAAIEGEVQVLTQYTNNPQSLSNQFYANYNAWLNTEEHYRSKEDYSRCVSYMTARTSDKTGVILVKRSEAEKGYHYANYWSDDFNQSYIIDNETGKTYSLSQFPRIYSVKNGIIQIIDAPNPSASKFYKPQIVDGELNLQQVEISAELGSKYSFNQPCTDIHGNMLFLSTSPLTGADEYGEVREGGFIFTGYNQQFADNLGRSGAFGQAQANSYIRANRYQLGSDGQIYRLDFRGNMNSIPMHVLNAQGEWVNVPETANVDFTSTNGWITTISLNAGQQQYLLLTQISNGKAFFANAALGSDLPFTMYTDMAMYRDYGFIGVSALPTDGSADTQMQSFMSQTNLTSNDIVYRVGSTAFAYEDRQTNELVIWDRATETQKRIAVGAPILENKGTALCLRFMANYPACFQASTANGMRYIEYSEQNPTKEWSEYSATPVESTLKIDAYYQFLNAK